MALYGRDLLLPLNGHLDGTSGGAGLRWMRVSRKRFELVSLLVVMVVGGLGSGGQRDDSDNGSL